METTTFQFNYDDNANDAFATVQGILDDFGIKYTVEDGKTTFIHCENYEEIKSNISQKYISEYNILKNAYNGGYMHVGGSFDEWFKEYKSGE